MKTADLVTKQIDRDHEIKIEMPLSDAYRVMRTLSDVLQFIHRYGDLEIEYDEVYDVYRVPSFATGRSCYSEAKQRDCDRFGCE